MKRFILFFAMLPAVLTAIGQDDVYGAQDVHVDDPQKKLQKQMGDIADINLTDDGAYEKKEVVDVEGASAAVLFVRAMEALSDWTGPDGKAKAGVDFQDKETGTVIYKGRYSLGFKNTFLGDGWSRYAEFTLKVRTKDGRAQVTVTVPKVTAVYSRNGTTREGTVAQLVIQVEKAKGAKGERGEKLLENLTGTADVLVKAMAERLKKGADDDDDF